MVWYFSILIYFLIVETAIIYVINNGIKKYKQSKLISLYMSARVVKILLSLAFLGVYALIVKTGIRSFAIVFMLFYLCSIGFETWYFVSKELRQNNEEKEE